MDSSAFWEQQPLSARGYASTTIIPACHAVVDMSTNSRDLIERELAAFSQSLDNSLCRLPATPQVSSVICLNRLLPNNICLLCSHTSTRLYLLYLNELDKHEPLKIC
nr:unknown [Zea mays]